MYCAIHFVGGYYFALTNISTAKLKAICIRGNKHILNFYYEIINKMEIIR